jgi:hypothetical protein
VAAVVGLWVVGVMSPATLAGGESGPVFPFSDQSEDGVVSVSVNESTVDPSGRVTVTVNVDGNPASDATVRVAGESYATGEDGTVVVSVDEPGAYEVTGVRPDGSRSTTTTLRVRRYQTALSVSAPQRVVTAETVPVRVTRADGGPVDATVVVDEETVRTGADGVANVSFPVAGEFDVRATKAATDRYRFEPGQTTVTVDRRRVRLVATANRSTPRVDERVAVSVRRGDTGERVNATLAVGNRTVRTGADGVGNVSFPIAGAVRVVATANRTDAVRFENATARVAVQRLRVPLSVSVSPRPVAEGDRARFVVRRTDTGDRVDASVSLFGTPYPTGDDGRVSFPFYVPGDAIVSASKASTPRERFVAANASFRVVGPEVVASAVSVPVSAPANATMRVNATLSNVGNEPASEDAVVTVGGATTRVPTTVEPGETTTANWTAVTPNATGNVTVVVAYEEVRVERTVELVAPRTNESTNASNVTAVTTVERSGASARATNVRGSSEPTAFTARSDAWSRDDRARAAFEPLSNGRDAQAAATAAVVTDYCLLA